jgi:transcriptional regulator with XRE-family HTH domain
MDIGRRLKLMRQSRGYSQGDIEKRSGLLRSYISRVEGGYTTPSLATLERFAKALDVETYELLVDSNGERRPPASNHKDTKSKQAYRLLKLFDGMSAHRQGLLLSLADKLNKG